MYSAKINGEPTTFGTSGLLYRSNKLMYDRLTNTIWNQFTGVPVIGPLADSGIQLTFFPVFLTSWGEWLDEHPDTTVLALETGIYPPWFYEPESHPDSTYYDYFHTDETMFPVWLRDEALETKDVVLGLGIGDAFKAYPVKALQQDRVVNDALGGTDVLVIGSALSQAARVYEREGHFFSLSPDDAIDRLPTRLAAEDGDAWLVTEEYLVNESDRTQKLARIPTHMAFWFGWFEFHPDTEVYTPAGQ